MTTVSSILSRRIPWRVELSRLQSIVSQKNQTWVKWLRIGMHTYIYLFIYKLFTHSCHYRMLSKVTCGFVVGPCWLSILNIVVCICQPSTPDLSLLPPNFPFGNHQFGFYIDVFLMCSLGEAAFSRSHVWMWELDYKESWVEKNWCFCTVVLEKTLKSPLDSKEIQPAHPKRDQSWIFIGRTDAEAETLILRPSDGKNWAIWNDPDAGKD